MPRSRRSISPKSQAGFTLVEAVMVIVLTGILAAIVSVFIVPPVQAYLSTAARVNLVDQADTALRRIGRDLAIALPNSTRVVPVTGLTLELIPTTGAARYATEGAGQLQFGVTDTSFDLVGPALALGIAQQLVFYNLGPDVPDANAYAANGSAAEQASSNRRTATNAAGPASTLTLSSTAGLPVGLFAPPYRVYAVSSPVSYRCDLTAQTLTRYQGYGFLANQPDPPMTGSASILAKGVTACRFSYEAAAVAARAALITLQLTLTTNTVGGPETVSLYHALHVDNLP